MIVFAKAKKEEIQDEVIGKYNLLEIPVEIEELWLSMNLSLCKKTMKSSLNTWNTELIRKCWEYLSNKQISVSTNWWDIVELNKYALSVIVSDLALSSFDCWSDVFLVDVVTPKDQLNKFKKDNKDIVSEMKELKKVKAKPKTREVTLEDVMNTLNEIKQQRVVNAQVRDRWNITTQLNTPLVDNSDWQKNLTLNDILDLEEQKAAAATNSWDWKYKRATLTF